SSGTGCNDAPMLSIRFPKELKMWIPSPWFSQLSRSLCYLAGAWLADHVVRRRERPQPRP
ncbi:MAG: hypothetical protein WC934_07965, partial [Acidithiobacillus sp.]